MGLNIPSMTGKKKCILYVDDDSDDREIFEQAIHEENQDAEVVCAENGWEALHYLKAHSSDSGSLPCLIVLDINMPYMDGKETLNRIKEDVRLQHVPVVIFTSSEKPADKNLFKELGIEMISKPSNYNVMGRIAQRMLGFCQQAG
jgi:CheY-like chemotaxis protein